ncbi:MAG: 3'-5' exonuclease [Rhodocyclaceae bacterium]|nr:3'-5' exonuclease [Rhodocyclaceae bacterium]
MIPVLCFDIETIPDIAGIRRLYDLPPSLAEEEVAEFAFQKQRAKSGSDFLPHHLQRVIVISCLLRSDEGVRVWSLAEPKSSEAEIIQRFFEGIGKYTPQLVSWNGGGFDLPVLHYRGLIHGVTAARYWDMGEEEREFRYNNYVNRYHMRHLDLMDLLALYQPRANAPLDELAKLMGLPGKLSMDGAAVWEAWCAGEIDAIRDYCEVDVVNTYLVFLAFQKMRGHLSAQEHCEEIHRVRAELEKYGQNHWREFLSAWGVKA